MSPILVVNIHGMINARHDIRRALSELKVEKKFTASIVKDEPSTIGMLKLCKDYVAWSNIDIELLSLLLKERGKVSERKRLDEQYLKRLGFNSYDELAEKIVRENMKLSSIDGIRPFFKLSPPKGGFKRSTRRQFNQGGVLGENPKLGELVRRMI